VNRGLFLSVVLGYAVITGAVPFDAPGGRTYEVIFVYDPLGHDQYNRSYTMMEVFCTEK